MVLLSNSLMPHSYKNVKSCEKKLFHASNVERSGESLQSIVKFFLSPKSFQYHDTPVNFDFSGSVYRKKIICYRIIGIHYKFFGQSLPCHDAL